MEGLAWLGREPEARASILYRLVRLFARFVLFGVFRFRITATGRERLPTTGGYLLIGAAHRGWMDPFLVMHALPLEPRAWFLGQRAIDVHGPLARGADPPARRAAPGVARRRRHRAARRVGPRRRPQRGRVRPDARGDRQRAARPDRAVPDRRRAHRPPDRRPGGAARDGGQRGALHRPADGHARCSRPRARASCWATPGTARHRRSDLARSSRLRGRSATGSRPCSDPPWSGSTPGPSTRRAIRAGCARGSRGCSCGPAASTVTTRAAADRGPDRVPSRGRDAGKRAPAMRRRGILPAPP